MIQVLLGLGSNKSLDDISPLKLLFLACKELSLVLAKPSFSSVYKTKAMYVEDQEDFYNMVVLGFVPDDFNPFTLLDLIHKIENKYGRDRSKEIRFGPRTLDIDIELYGNQVINTPDLEIPHIRMEERAFVLVPACEVLKFSADDKVREKYENCLARLNKQDVSSVEKIVDSSEFNSLKVAGNMEVSEATVTETTVATKEKHAYKAGEFEGPLDLLWALIRESKVNIYDIPIAQITEQYLEYLDYAVQTDLGDLSEFYSWAAKLIYIKSRMLLPVEVAYDDDDDEDPRQELVDKLIEYQKFKKLSSLMEEQEDDSAWSYERKKIQRVLPFEETAEMWEEIDTWDLLQQMQSIFKTMMKKYSDGTILNMYEEISVNEKLTLMNELLENNNECMFTDLLTRPGNEMDVICAFMAILEAVKFRMIRILQNKLFVDIKIVAREDSDNYIPTEEDLTAN